MSKQKMLAAKELIQEKKYDEARAILKTVNHPTAKEWLDRLDTIASEKPQKQKRGSNLLKFGLLVFVGLPAACIAIVLLSMSSSSPTVTSSPPDISDLVAAISNLNNYEGATVEEDELIATYQISSNPRQHIILFRTIAINLLDDDIAGLNQITLRIIDSSDEILEELTSSKSNLLQYLRNQITETQFMNRLERKSN